MVNRIRAKSVFCLRLAAKATKKEHLIPASICNKTYDDFWSSFRGKFCEPIVSPASYFDELAILLNKFKQPFTSYYYYLQKRLGTLVIIT